MQELVLLKLGGSLITDKTQPYTVRLEKLADLATQIKHALQTRPNLLLILGHGSGSFGHTAAKEYGTREGVATSLHLPSLSEKTGGVPRRGEGGYWRGFSEVWYQASALNRHVIEILHEAGIPAMTFSPAASVYAKNGRVAKWDLSQLKKAVENGILPVVHGDVIFDRDKGGTILSTEELFEYLARELQPCRILLAGHEDGIWTDFPVRRHKVEKVTRETFDEIRQSIGEAVGTDVTGGMESKVKKMLTLAEAVPGLSIQIFSGEKPQNLVKVLLGEHLGTIIEL